MKQTLIMFASILAMTLTACNNDGDKSMYLQAQMVNHISNVDVNEEASGAIRSDAVVYEVILNTDNMTADVACTVTLPDGKRGTIDVRGMALSVDSKTGGYHIQQNAGSRSQGSYAVTGFSGVLDLVSSGYSDSHFTFVVEKHYQVNAIIAEMRFINVKAAIKPESGEEHKLTDGGTIIVTLKPSSKKATVALCNIDYDGSLGNDNAIVYENLDYTPNLYGYEITADTASPVNDGDSKVNKYKLKDFKAELKFFGQIEASYSIDGIGEVKAKN